MEDRLFEALKHMNMGGGSPDMLKMLRQAQLNAFRQMRKSIDDKIRLLEATDSMASSDMDPFSILGVNQNVTEEELTRAYRAQSKQAHPDVGGTNEEQVKINAAYQTIRQFKGWA